MTDAEQLTAVKKALGITGTYQDDTISQYIFETKQYLLDAGVHPLVLSEPASTGVISRGVADLWNYGSSDTKLSEYFYQRAIQLTLFNVVGVMFDVTPDDAMITVEDSDGNIVNPEVNRTYKLIAGNYTYTITATGYVSITDKALVISQSDVTVTETLEGVGG